MALEAGDYIDDLVVTNPTGNDNRRQGDDHMRLIKKVLTQSFPNIDGAVTATPADLNKTSDLTNYFPSGGIIMWAGLIADIPTGWALCNGTGTAGGIAIPDLRAKFIIGAQADVGTKYDVNDTGGVSDIALGSTQSHTLTESQIPAHTHTLPGKLTYTATSQTSAGQASGTVNNHTSGSTGGGTGHSHGIATEVDGNIPPFYALAYIIKL